MCLSIWMIGWHCFYVFFTIWLQHRMQVHDRSKEGDRALPQQANLSKICFWKPDFFNIGDLPQRCAVVWVCVTTWPVCPLVWPLSAGSVGSPAYAIGHQSMTSSCAPAKVETGSTSHWIAAVFFADHPAAHTASTLWSSVGPPPLKKMGVVHFWRTAIFCVNEPLLNKVMLCAFQQTT